MPADSGKKHSKIGRNKRKSTYVGPSKAPRVKGSNSPKIRPTDRVFGKGRFSMGGPELTSRLHTPIKDRAHLLTELEESHTPNERIPQDEIARHLTPRAIDILRTRPARELATP